MYEKSLEKDGPMKDYFEAIGNIFIFLPYFFSVSTLIHTFFSPWKNITVKKEIRGFTFADFFSRLGFNLISRGIGIAMRGSLLVFYTVTQTVYVIAIIPLTVIVFVTIPLRTLFRTSGPTEEEKMNARRAAFLRTHILEHTHETEVNMWFDRSFVPLYQSVQWWKLSQLFQTPPLARDWAVGYTPLLDEYCDELTHVDYQQSIRHQVIGREEQTSEIERALLQSEEANAIIVGSGGVGKHTILNAFARKLYEGKTMSLLAYKRVMKLQMEKILSEHTAQQDREAFIEKLLAEARDAGNVIIVIDEFDRYVTHGEGRVDLTVALGKFLRSPKVQFLAITTPFSFQTYIFPNEKLREGFTKIDIEELTPVVVMQVLLDRIPEFERRYRLTIPYETALEIVQKSNFYITSIPFPEKALQLLDASCVAAVSEIHTTTLMPPHVDRVLSERTHMPIVLNDTLKQKLLHLEEMLHTRIVGQKTAITEVASALRRAFLLLGTRKKPLASFLFLGPTGVGKTETAKTISDTFFSKDHPILRFDMSLYQSTNDIAKLIGSVQTLNPGLLTSAIRENPYGVLLIDEIEKANHDLLNIFLTILDEGYFTDGYGQNVDCKNLVIVATSNAGSTFIFQQLAGQSQSQLPLQMQSADALVTYLVNEHIFSPEFLNRFDGVIGFQPIANDTALEIASQIVGRITKDILDTYHVHVQVSTEYLRKITAKGFNSQYGVRNLERIIRREIEDTIAQKILSGEVKDGGTLAF